MSDFFQWLSGGSPSAIIFISAIGILLVGLTLIYIVAFIQGREISFWLPKIGEKPNKSKDSAGVGKKSQSGNPSPLISGVESRVQLNLPERLKSFRTLELLGYNLASVLRDIRDPIVNAINQNGAVVRIIVLDIESEAGITVESHSNRPHLIIPEMVNGLEHIRDIQKRILPHTTGRLEVKITSWIPSCNMILIDSNDENGIGKIGINSPAFRQPMTGRIGLIFTRKEFATELDYFVKSFHALWENEKDCIT